MDDAGSDPLRRNTVDAITVVVPCLDEADNIAHVYREIVAELSRYGALELMFVDDGSTDATLAEIRALAASDARVSYLSFSRNFGLEAAFSAGYRYARHPWVLHLDADLQFPPAEAHRLVERAADGFDAVFGIREDRRDPWVRRAGSAVSDGLARRLLRIEMPAGATTFRLVRASLARRIVDLRLGTPYFLATVPRLTRAWTTVPTAHRPRERGTSKVSVRGLARHALELYVAFSDRPMAAAGGGFLLAAAAALVGGFAGAAGHNGTALALLGAALAAGLLGLAVLARHLVHVGRGQPRPPLYLVREANVAVDPADLLIPETAAHRDGPDRPDRPDRRDVPAPPVPRGAVAAPRGRAGGPMRSLVVLGGADGQIVTLRTAARLGLHTICVDARADAPALAEADEVLALSTRDVEGIVAALAGRSDVAGVLSPASDVNLPSQYALAHRLGLPNGVSRDALRASVDKGFFRDVCDRLGLPGPRWVQGTPGAVAAAAADLRFPVLVKPTDSSGGRGIGSCDGPAELPAAVEAAAAVSLSGIVVAEEYLEGAHLTAEAVVVDGVVALLGVGDRSLTPPPHFVTTEHRMPSRIAGVTEAVREALDRVCRALRYRWGALDVDVLVTPDGDVVLVEMGARLGGNGSAELLGLVHGVDVMAAHVAMAVGDPCDLVPRRTGHAAFHVLGARSSGTLLAVSGLAELRALPEVVDVVLAAEPGDAVHPYTRAGAKLGYVLVAADDRETLSFALARVDDVLHFDVLETATAPRVAASDGGTR